MKSHVQSSKSISIRNKDYALVALNSTEATALTTPTFSPADVPGLKAWWDADSVPGLLDAATLSTWRDLSGNGFDLTIGTGTPTIRRNVLNGKSVVRFNGSTRMTCANVLNQKTSVSVFFVWIPRASNTNILFEQGLSDISYENTGALDARFYIGGVGGAAGPVAGTQDVAQFTTLLSNGNQLINRKNGVSGTPASFSGNTSSNTFNMGARSSNSFFTTSDVAEFIVYDRLVTDEERDQIEAYFAAKYFFYSRVQFPTGLPVRARWAPESMSINGSVFTWADLSGNGLNATKSSGTLPTIVNGVNGLPAVRGVSGQDRRLTVSTAIMDGLSSFACLCIWKGPSSPSALMAMFGSATYGSAGTDVFNLSIETNSYPIYSYFRCALTSGDKSLTANNTVPNSSQWNCSYVDFSEGIFTKRMNGVQGSSNTGSGVLKNATGFYLLGNAYTSTSIAYWGGDIHEIIFFNNKLTDAQKTQLGAYVTGNYGVTL